MIGKWLVLILLVPIAALAVGETNKVKTFGQPVGKAEALTLNQALERHAQKPKEDVVVSGTVTKVCETKGCWLTLKSDEVEMRMTFANYGFFVPTELESRSVRAQGRIVAKTESVSEQRHYLEDAGASAEEIKAIKKPKTTKSFVATGVEVTP